MKVQRFSEYEFEIEAAQLFLNSFDNMVNESDESHLKKIMRKVISDLKLNTSLVFTFGAGIGACYPVVQSLMQNMGVDSFVLSEESILLLTITALTILYLEEKKCKSIDEEERLTKDAKSMLEELKMKGIGNGIVKKVIASLKSIKNIFNVIGKHIGAVIGGVVDMFAYTSLLIPIMNGILAIIKKYDLNLETLTQNLIGLAAGIGTIIAKHGIVEILKRIKDKFNIKVDQKEIIDDLETPSIQKFSTFGDAEKEEQPGDLIKEQ